MLVNPLQLFFAEVQVIQRLHVLLQLLCPAGANQYRGDTLIFQQPAQRHLRHRLSARLGHLIEQTQAVQVGFGQHVLRQVMTPTY